MARKRRTQPKRDKEQVSCPLCDAQAIVADVPKAVSDMLNLQAPGFKYVCSGKFIYRSNTQDLQFSPCYGMPVEASVKMLQLIDRATGKRSFSKKEVYEIYENVSNQNPLYMSSVFKFDPFFERIKSYLPKSALADPVITVPKEDPEVDLKLEMHDE